MKTIISLAATLMITGCSGITNNNQMNTLPDTLQIGQSILSRDTVEQVAYPTLTQEQCLTLHDQTKRDVPKGTQLIGVRSVGNGMTLAAYKMPMSEDSNHFKVYLLTTNSKDDVIDNIDLGEFHTSEHQGPLRFGGNRFYTTDADLHFDSIGNFTVHRVMTLTSLYLKNHPLTEMWRVEWIDNYVIDNTGHFVFKGQQETLRTPTDLNDPTIDDFKARFISK